MFIGVSAGMVLGVPIVNFLANVFTLEISLTFFALVNIFAFIMTIVFIPSMPVQEKLSYGS